MHFDDGCYVGVGEEVKFNICGLIYWDKCKGQCQIKHHVIIASTL